MTAPRFSVIIGTLMRPSYSALITSLRQQTNKDFEVVTNADASIILSVARNRACRLARGEILVFRDDDTTLPPEHLQRIEEAFLRNPLAVGLTGPIIMGDGCGNRRTWGENWMGIGANLTIRADAYAQTEGFPEYPDLGKLSNSWRDDSTMWWELGSKFGTHRLIWDTEVKVEHPGLTGGYFVPAVEDRFFKRFRKYYMEMLIPFDQNCQTFVLETQDVSPEEVAYILKCRKELRAKLGAEYVPRIPLEEES